MKNTIQHNIYTKNAAPKTTIPYITAGTIVDTNDPFQEGRVRVLCATLNESSSTPLKDIPWALYMSPFIGHTEVGDRGPGIQDSRGPISYGFWAPPKIGAQVLVTFIDGNPNLRVVVGCIGDLFRSHTMPHGRFMYEDHPGLETGESDAKPFGPFTSNEGPIEPLATNMKQAFANKNEPNFEWRTRAADYSVSAVDLAYLQNTTSKVADDKDVVWDGWTSRQGYQVNRVSPGFEALYNEGNLDNNVYCWVTPGFHALSMDDRQENCRIRFRTTSGHQIIMDDTNERIYVSTAQGNNWIEMDQQGNIDIFTTNKVSVHAAKDINLTSDQTIRLYGKKGLHLLSGTDIRMESQQDVHLRFKQNLRLNVSQSIFMQSGQDTHIRSSRNVFVEAVQNINHYATSELKLTSGVSMHLSGGTRMYQTAGRIDQNGPAASIADRTQPPREQQTFWTNRVPDHEPWARTMTLNDFTHRPEFIYTSPNVNRVERGITLPRGKYWRR